MARFRKVFEATNRAIKEEIKEVKSLTITKDDTAQAKAMRRVIVAAANAYGIPVPEEIQVVLDKALAHILRDCKDGIKTPEKLLIRRIIDNIKEDYK